MKLMKFIRSNISFIMSGIAALGLGVALGKGLPVDPFGQENPLPAPEETVEPVGQMGTASILPDTVVSWHYHFMSCGHKVQIQPPKDVTGYTISDITKEYPNAQVVRMDENRVEIELRVEAYCPDHYLLIATPEDSLCVLQTNLTTLVGEQVMEIPVSVKDFSSEIQYSLLNGITFDSLQAINEYLEDIES